jgi:hypothetical protein
MKPTSSFLGPPADACAPTPRLQVLKELSDDRSLERFKIEYEKLFKALKKSHGGSPC